MVFGLRNWPRGKKALNAGKSKRRVPSSWLLVEQLEDRRLLAAGLGPSLLANTASAAVVAAQAAVAPIIMSPAGYGSPAPGNLPQGLVEYSPTQIQTAYGFSQIASLKGNYNQAGSGQEIAIVDAYNDPNIVNDVQQFDMQYKIAGAAGQASITFLTVVNQSGGSTLPVANAAWAGDYEVAPRKWIEVALAELIGLIGQMV
jgi:hypothetical protein